MSASAAKALALVAALLAVGCSEPGGDRAARVNRETLTQAQLDALQKRQSGVPASQLLERLIDQELAVQEAEGQHLAREAAVQQQLEMARREVLARAWAERVGAEVAAPTAAEVEQTYRTQPALYAERQLYALRELFIEVEPAQQGELRSLLQQFSELNEFVERLRQDRRRFTVNQTLRGPEQLSAVPLARLTGPNALKPGQLDALEVPGGLLVLHLLGRQPQPLTLAQAQPLIEQRLLAERRAQRVQQALRELRANARIEYFGAHAKPASQP